MVESVKVSVTYNNSGFVGMAIGSKSDEEWLRMDASESETAVYEGHNKKTERLGELQDE